MNFTFDPTISLAVLITMGNIVFTWYRTRDRQIETRLKTGSDRMDRHEIRLTQLEQSIKSMPSREDVHNIELSMERMNGTMGRMEAVLEGNQQIMARLESIVSRHEDHLLQGNNK